MAVWELWQLTKAELGQRGKKIQRVSPSPPLFGGKNWTAGRERRTDVQRVDQLNENNPLSEPQKLGVAHTTGL